METEMGLYSIPELHQTPNTPRLRNPDMLSSWLELDNNYAPTFPDELPDLQMLEEHLFQFAASDIGMDPSSFQSSDAMDDSFLLDLCNFNPVPSSESNDTYCPILPKNCESDDVVHHSTAHENGGSQTSVIDTFLNDEFSLTSPAESYESFADQVLGVGSSSSTATITSRMDVHHSSIAPQLSQNQEEEYEEEENDEGPKKSNLNSKNLFSERNRRKRLSQQLLALRALVPNITKMDKRSVLVDALAHVRSMHEEIARIQSELNERPRKSRCKSCPENAPEPIPPVCPSAPVNSSKPKSQILKIDTEKIEDRRFIVKITCKEGAGVGGEVLHVIEDLDFEITYTSLEQFRPQHMLLTVFIRGRKQGRMTEEKLKDCITSKALRSGLILHDP